jgi:CheY-like chemotaxis protein
MAFFSPNRRPYYSRALPKGDRHSSRAARSIDVARAALKAAFLCKSKSIFLPMCRELNNGKIVVQNRKGTQRKMAENGASALIVANPGPLRDGLRALLIAMLEVHAVEEACDLPSALKMALGRPPALVVLDSGLAGSEIWLAARQAKAKWPQAQCIFLVNSVKEQSEAEAAGADAVLLKGVPPAKLIATIVRLLPQRGGQEERCDVIVSGAQHNQRARRFGRQHRLVL